MKIKKRNAYSTYLKRSIDLIISMLGLPFLLLLHLPISICILISDGRPVFYNASRIGRNGKSFKMFKYRTMFQNSPDIRLKDGSTYNAKDDARVTKIGRFLRESSLDEIPQILNILKGEMSFIGPRPDMNINEKFRSESIYNLRERPGLTGYTQVYFRNETDWETKILHDRYYVDNISLGIDVMIFLKTIFMVLKRDKLYRKAGANE